IQPVPSPQPELLRFGGLIISKDLAGVLLPFLGTLLGAVVGGCMTYIVMAGAEKRRSRRDRLEKKRTALAETLEWLAPIARLLGRAVESVEQSEPPLDEPDFRRRFPDALCAACDRPPPLLYRVFVPSEIINDLITITSNLQDLKRKCLSPLPPLGQCLKEAAEIHGILCRCQDKLSIEYERTWE
ncbi:MAG: hypothetical protein ACM3X6_10285, partial [Patescibacteria group bacterium]